MGKPSPLTVARIEELEAMGFVWSYWDYNLNNFEGCKMKFLLLAIISILISSPVTAQIGNLLWEENFDELFESRPLSEISTHRCRLRHSQSRTAILFHQLSSS